MKRTSVIIASIVVIILVDVFFILNLYKVNSYIDINIIMNYDKVLFRLIYIINLLLISYIVGNLINMNKDFVSIRPIRIEDGIILFSSQTKKNMEMYTDLHRYYVYESKNNKFVIDKFYLIDRKKYGEIKKINKKGFPEAYDLHKYKAKDFR